MLKLRIFALSLAIFCALPMLAAHATPIETKAKQAIVIDYETGTVLLSKNEKEQMPTSSMSKVMTMYAVFDSVKNGQISLNDTLPVSEKAWRMGGSKMFVEVDKRVKVEDLIRGVIVQSGN
ncbi:MAG: D-alanyl-D-alanine carboxypeptidase, partial [Alphaproteobacteria bacterium]|nr:D-alanyl-D-alanine carboxypeptidase [Alphaproteobacteria bacterium]